MSLRDRRKAERGRLRELSQAQRAAKRGVSADVFQPSRGSRPIDPIDRLSFADQAIAEMTSRRETCSLQARLKAKAAEEAAATTATDAATTDTVTTDTAGADTAAATSPATIAELTAPVDSATVRWFWPSFVVLGASVVLLVVAITLR